ncbi:hypothetical protein D1AOALGA4SA_1438 [Olavius algarvensis Delta 1 endosymbiont]|nr:hypothetical protein D1AOALGA4SA_1438 [Olavius algarvensis Delta 1 endosymbiont]
MSQYAPRQLSEYEQPYIGNLILGGVLKGEFNFPKIPSINKAYLLI